MQRDNGVCPRLHACSGTTGAAAQFPDKLPTRQWEAPWLSRWRGAERVWSGIRGRPAVGKPGSGDGECRKPHILRGLSPRACLQNVCKRYRRMLNNERKVPMLCCKTAWLKFLLWFLEFKLEILWCIINAWVIFFLCAADRQNGL